MCSSDLGINEARLVLAKELGFDSVALLGRAWENGNKNMSSIYSEILKRWQETE